VSRYNGLVKDVLGVILGGGKGTRLFPLTLIRSKPAVPLGGKYRLIDIPVSNCINSGVNKIFVLTQYNSESLNRHITQTYRFGLFSRGFVDILAAEQTPESVRWYQGTADAVRQTLRHMLHYEPSQILILSGDHLYRMNYQQLVQHHREKQADVTVCVVPVPVETASSFGILKMNSDGGISEFFEKPRNPKLLEELKVDVDAWRDVGISEERPLMASMGVYLFNPDVLCTLLKDDTKMDFGRDVIPSALPEYRVQGFVFTGYWEDIGTIEAFYRANLDLTQDCPAFTFYDNEAPIYTHPRFLPASRMQKCQVERVIISDGCDITDSTITDSVIGIRSIIRNGTQLTRTLMMGADFYEFNSRLSVPLGIGEGTIIENAIIDKNARIGRNVQILNLNRHVHHDDELYFVRDGIICIPKNTLIPDGTKI